MGCNASKGVKLDEGYNDININNNNKLGNGNVPRSNTKVKLPTSSTKSTSPETSSSSSTAPIGTTSNTNANTDKTDQFERSQSGGKVIKNTKKKLSPSKKKKNSSISANSVTNNNNNNNTALPKTILKIRDAGARLHAVLSSAADISDVYAWARCSEICESSLDTNKSAQGNKKKKKKKKKGGIDNNGLDESQQPSPAHHIDPSTGETALHAACRAIHISPPPPPPHSPKSSSSNDGPKPHPGSVELIRTLLRLNPDAPSIRDSNGLIPLHHMLAFTPNPTGSTSNVPPPPPEEDVSRIMTARSDVLPLLIGADVEGSMQYLARDDVPLSALEPQAKCTPLYRAVLSLPDDSARPSGPSVLFIRTLVDMDPSSNSTTESPFRNNNTQRDPDTPLGLLYRRFSRQFDLSETFFPGDNSRNEVVQYRAKHKTAATNTWKIMLELLTSNAAAKAAGASNAHWGRPDKLSGSPQSASSTSQSTSSSKFVLHAAASAKEMPSDLFRYVVETRASEARIPDADGKLPLHYATASANATASTLKPIYHDKFVVDELLYAFPDGAAYPDTSGKLPIVIAAEEGKGFISGGIKALYTVYPEGADGVDVTRFPALANAVANFMDDDASVATERMDGLALPTNESRERDHDAVMTVQNPNVDTSDVISTMWANEEDGGVQMLGCAALARRAMDASERSKQSTSLPVALAGAAAAVNAMKNHPNTASVQELGCAALGAMADADGLREVSLSAGGALAAVVAAMQSHVSDAAVQTEACRTISSIAGGREGKAGATVVASASGLTAIQNAMGAHAGEVDVQRSACYALEALTRDAEGSSLPDLDGVQVGSLLREARKNFPVDCGIPADAVLARLDKH